MASVYLASCPDLPVDTPYGFPHLVVGGDRLQLILENENTRVRLHVADGVATALWNYNPQTLATFLDPRCRTFSFVRSGPHMFDLYIKRESDMVTCGFYMSNGQWDFKFVYRIDQSGLWVPVSGVAIRGGLILDATDKEERE